MDKIPYSVTVRALSDDSYNPGSSGGFMMMAKARLARWLSLFGAVVAGWFLAVQPAGASTGGVMETANFAAGVLSPSPARAVATFESLSLYWRPGDSAEARDCQVRYRPNPRRRQTPCRCSRHRPKRPKRRLWAEHRQPIAEPLRVALKK